MKPLLAVVLAALLAAFAWWWFTEEGPRREAEARQRAEAARVENERANSLYKWRDAEGVLQITEEPPQGRPYERISRTPESGLVVDGARGD